jgi:hypothetical protein
MEKEIFHPSTLYRSTYIAVGSSFLLVNLAYIFHEFRAGKIYKFFDTEMYLLVGGLICILLSLYLILRGVIRKVIVTKTILLDVYPLKKWEFPLNKIYHCSIKTIHEYGGVFGFSGDSSEKVISLMDKSERQLGKINVSDFRPSDVDTLLSVVSNQHL